LPKKSVIETINFQLRNVSQGEESIHRSFGDFITSFIANTLEEKKPVMNFRIEKISQLALFS
jgi:hypothetical protein